METKRNSYLKKTMIVLISNSKTRVGTQRATKKYHKRIHVKKWKVVQLKEIDNAFLYIYIYIYIFIEKKKKKYMKLGKLGFET